MLNKGIPTMAHTRLLIAALFAGAFALSGPLSAQPTPPAPPEAPSAPPAPGGKAATITGDHTVEKGETTGDLVVAGGDLIVRGQVRGDVVVVGGDLVLEDGGEVRGNALVSSGEILDHGGRIYGEMRTVDDLAHLAADNALSSIAAQADAEVARHTKHAPRARVVIQTGEKHGSSWFGPIRRGFAELAFTLAFALVLGGLGSVLVFYGRPYLDTVSDTLRASPARAGLVGLAAGFLVIPAFVVLIVALTVSIIGIPLLLVAVPLYPVAVAVACIFGLLAAAHALGERTAEQREEIFDLRRRNAYTYLFTGLAALIIVPLLIANLLTMTGFLNWVGVVVKVLVMAVAFAATTAGLGAVILSRAGTRRTFATRTGGTPLDPDPFFDHDSDLRGTHA